MQPGLHSELKGDTDGHLSEISSQKRREWVREQIAEWYSTRFKR